MAFLVVADALEEAGEHGAAETRRPWAEQMQYVALTVKDPNPAFCGYYVSIEDPHTRTHYTPDGSYAYNHQYRFWDREMAWALTSVIDNDPRPENAWYIRKGHWNKHKMLQKMSIAELVKWNSRR